MNSPTATRNIFPGQRIYRPLLNKLDAIFNSRGSVSAYSEATVQLMKVADDLARATPAEESVTVNCGGQEWILDNTDADGPGSFWNGCGWVDLYELNPKTRMALGDAWEEANAKSRADSIADAAIDAAEFRHEGVGLMGSAASLTAGLTVRV